MNAPEALPVFRYHPDPLATGSIIAAPDRPCLGCSRIRGYLYMGPVYTEKNFILEEHLCPWCIADGTAAKRFSASFNDAGTMEDVPDAVMEEIEKRTPGFHGWQQESWLTCCGDAAAYLGEAGAAELTRDFPGAIPSVRKYLEENYELAGKELEEFVKALRKGDQPTSFIFRCLHCQSYQAYIDQT